MVNIACSYRLFGSDLVAVHESKSCRRYYFNYFNFSGFPYSSVLCICCSRPVRGSVVSWPQGCSVSGGQDPAGILPLPTVDCRTSLQNKVQFNGDRIAAKMAPRTWR